ncbi:STM4015 family protein, partial [Streptomyces sp. NPDC002920]
MALDHISELHGLPVYDFPRPGADAAPLPAAETVAWKLSRDELVDGEEPFTACWHRFLDTVDPARVRALVLGDGAYGNENSAGPDDPVQLLAEAA